MKRSNLNDEKTPSPRCAPRSFEKIYIAHHILLVGRGSLGTAQIKKINKLVQTFSMLFEIQFIKFLRLNSQKQSSSPKCSPMKKKNYAKFNCFPMTCIKKDKPRWVNRRNITKKYRTLDSSTSGFVSAQISLNLDTLYTYPLRAQNCSPVFFS